MNDFGTLRMKAMCRARTNEEAKAIMSRKKEEKPECLTPALEAAGLAQSIVTNDVTTLKKYFAKGADPDARTSSDHEPLFFHAVGTGNIEMINAFLDAGSDIMQTDSSNGFSAIHAAVISGDYATILFMMARMVEEGADYHSLLQEALFTAIRNENLELTRLILESGANPNGDTWHGRRFYPPLLEAVRVGNKKIAELLIEYGAKNAKGSVEVEMMMADM